MASNSATSITHFISTSKDVYDLIYIDSYFTSHPNTPLLPEKNILCDLLRLYESVLNTPSPNSNHKKGLLGVVKCLQQFSFTKDDGQWLLEYEYFVNLMNKCVLYVANYLNGEKNFDAVLEIILDVIINISKTHLTLKTKMLQYLSPPIFDIIIDKELPIILLKKCLTSLTNLVTRSEPERRKEVMELVYPKLSKFFDQIYTCGDFDVQLCVVETLLRYIVPDKNRKLFFFHFKHKNPELIRNFLNIRSKDFDVDCRIFLNYVNKTQGDRTLVISIPCYTILLDEISIEKPTEQDLFWVDFNRRSLTISIWCNKNSLLTFEEMNVPEYISATDWMSVVIRPDIVKKVNINNSRSRNEQQQNFKEVKFDINGTIDIKPLSDIKCSQSKCVRIIFPRSTETDVLDQTILPEIFHQIKQNNMETKMAQKFPGIYNEDNTRFAVEYHHSCRTVPLSQHDKLSQENVVCDTECKRRSNVNSIKTRKSSSSKTTIEITNFADLNTDDEKKMLLSDIEPLKLDDRHVKESILVNELTIRKKGKHQTLKEMIPTNKTYESNTDNETITDTIHDKHHEMQEVLTENNNDHRKSSHHTLPKAIKGIKAVSTIDQEMSNDCGSCTANFEHSDIELESNKQNSDKRSKISTTAGICTFNAQNDLQNLAANDKYGQLENGCSTDRNNCNSNYKSTGKVICNEQYPKKKLKISSSVGNCALGIQKDLLSVETKLIEELHENTEDNEAALGSTISDENMTLMNCSTENDKNIVNKSQTPNQTTKKIARTSLKSKAEQIVGISEMNSICGEGRERAQVEYQNKKVFNIADSKNRLQKITSSVKATNNIDIPTNIPSSKTKTIDNIEVNASVPNYVSPKEKGNISIVTGILTKCQITTNACSVGSPSPSDNKLSERKKSNLELNGTGTLPRCLSNSEKSVKIPLNIIISGKKKKNKKHCKDQVVGLTNFVNINAEKNILTNDADDNTNNGKSMDQLSINLQHCEVMLNPITISEGITKGSMNKHSQEYGKSSKKVIIESVTGLRRSKRLRLHETMKGQNTRNTKQKNTITQNKLSGKKCQDAKSTDDIILDNHNEYQCEEERNIIENELALKENNNNILCFNEGQKLRDSNLHKGTVVKDNQCQSEIASHNYTEISKKSTNSENKMEKENIDSEIVIAESSDKKNENVNDNVNSKIVINEKIIMDTCTNTPHKDLNSTSHHNKDEQMFHDNHQLISPTRTMENEINISDVSNTNENIISTFNNSKKLDKNKKCGFQQKHLQFTNIPKNIISISDDVSCSHSKHLTERESVLENCFESKKANLKNKTVKHIEERDSERHRMEDQHVSRMDDNLSSISSHGNSVNSMSKAASYATCIQNVAGDRTIIRDGKNIIRKLKRDSKGNIIKEQHISIENDISSVNFPANAIHSVTRPMFQSTTTQFVPVSKNKEKADLANKPVKRLQNASERDSKEGRINERKEGYLSSASSLENTVHTVTKAVVHAASTYLTPTIKKHTLNKNFNTVKTKSVRVYKFFSNNATSPVEERNKHSRTSEIHNLQSSMTSINKDTKNNSNHAKVTKKLLVAKNSKVFDNSPDSLLDFKTTKKISKSSNRKAANKSTSKVTKSERNKSQLKEDSSLTKGTCISHNFENNNPNSSVRNLRKRKAISYVIESSVEEKDSPSSKCDSDHPRSSKINQKSTAKKEKKISVKKKLFTQNHLDIVSLCSGSQSSSVTDQFVNKTSKTNEKSSNKVPDQPVLDEFDMIFNTSPPPLPKIINRWEEKYRREKRLKSSQASGPKLAASSLHKHKHTVYSDLESDSYLSASFLETPFNPAAKGSKAENLSSKYLSKSNGNSKGMKGSEKLFISSPHNSFSSTERLRGNSLASIHPSPSSSVGFSPLLTEVKKNRKSIENVQTNAEIESGCNLNNLEILMKNYKSPENIDKTDINNSCHIDGLTKLITHDSVKTICHNKENEATSPNNSSNQYVMHYTGNQSGNNSTQQKIRCSQNTLTFPEAGTFVGIKKTDMKIVTDIYLKSMFPKKGDNLEDNLLIQDVDNEQSNNLVSLQNSSRENIKDLKSTGNNCEEIPCKDTECNIQVHNLDRNTQPVLPNSTSEASRKKSKKFSAKSPEVSETMINLIVDTETKLTNKHPEEQVSEVILNSGRNSSTSSHETECNVETIEQQISLPGSTEENLNERFSVYNRLYITPSKQSTGKKLHLTQSYKQHHFKNQEHREQGIESNVDLEENKVSGMNLVTEKNIFISSSQTNKITLDQVGQRQSNTRHIVKHTVQHYSESHNSSVKISFVSPKICSSSSTSSSKILEESSDDEHTVSIQSAARNSDNFKKMITEKIKHINAFSCNVSNALLSELSSSSTSFMNDRSSCRKQLDESVLSNIQIVQRLLQNLNVYEEFLEEKKSEILSMINNQNCDREQMRGSFNNIEQAYADFADFSKNKNQFDIQRLLSSLKQAYMKNTLRDMLQKCRKIFDISP